MQIQDSLVHLPSDPILLLFPQNLAFQGSVWCSDNGDISRKYYNKDLQYNECVQLSLIHKISQNQRLSILLSYAEYRITV